MKAATRKPTHPGEIIAVMLEDIGQTEQQAATAIGIHIDYFSLIVKGKENITPYLAFKIQKGIDISARLLARMQFNYDLWMAEKEFNEREKQ